ncbi:MAG: class II glutamine amidotransferase, partial [Acidimicrobiia bacterium]
APIWSDELFAARATQIWTEAGLAAARAASPGATIAVTGNAPFTSERWLFSLNGRVDGFYQGVGDELREGLGHRWHGTFDGDADSEVLFAIALEHLDAGLDPGTALTAVYQRISARSAGPLNLLLTDGRRIAATASVNSLFSRERDGAVTIASEPLDNGPDWQRVPDGSLLEAEGGGITVTPLEAHT